MTFPFEALTSLSGTNITAKISLQLRFQGSFTVLWFGGQCLLLSASSFEQLPQLIQINAAFIWLQLCLPTFKFVCGGKTPSTTFQNMNWKLGARCEQLQSHHSEDTHSCGWPSAPASSWQTPSPGSSGRWCWLWPGGTPLLVLSVLCGDSGPELAGLPVGSWEMTEASNMDSMRCTRNSCCRFVISTNPVAVKDDDGVSSCQIDSQSSCSGAQQEDEHLWIFGKPGHLSETENDKNDSTIYSERQFGC